MAILGSHLSNKQKQKLRLANLGKKLSIATRKKMGLSRSGVNNHNYGKHLSLATKQKLRLANLGKKLSINTKEKIGLARTGKKLSPETREKMRQVKLRDKNLPEIIKRMHLALIEKGISLESRKKMSLAKLGAKSPTWKGGITPDIEKIRKSMKYNEWRQQIFLRDNFTCQECGDKTSGNFEIHHIKPFNTLIDEARKYLPLFSLYDAAMAYTPLWIVENGETLCEKCHKKRHSKRIGDQI